MSTKKKIIIAVIIIALLSIGGYIYYKKNYPAAAASGDINALKKLLASENYKLFSLNGYANRVPKPADADQKIAAQKAVIADIEAKIKALGA